MYRSERKFSDRCLLSCDEIRTQYQPGDSITVELIRLHLDGLEIPMSPDATRALIEALEDALEIRSHTGCTT